jgi:hypothetical protein
MKSGNLNLLERSGPLQAGNGADCFTFTFYFLTLVCNSSQEEKLIMACGATVLLLLLQGVTNLVSNALRTPGMRNE